ncbi:MAG: glycine cleavage system aminomethyltransferase GcvT [Ignavibacteria bacterium]|nr:glycine cleavage system aminomethyltransferase GcvT [Ignavibacteria bacterium]
MIHTIFHKHHTNAGAKMVQFAGFEMPIQYPTGILEEHRTVRNAVGVFDVSHMGEFEVTGTDALALIQHITLNDASKLVPGKAQYSAMCFDDGGIVDDLLVYMMSENNYMLVVNGANVTKDLAWVTKHAEMFPNVSVVDASNKVNLLAVQGPKSPDTLQPLTTTPLSEIPYYSFVETELAGIPMIVSRTGYTGEMGFELYFRGDEAVADAVIAALWKEGSAHGIAWIGLGARDTLRLEKGYCLYGNDIDATTNPIEAGLGWITKLAKGDFVASDVIAAVKGEGAKRKLVGFKMLTEKLIPRVGYQLQLDGKEIGKTTSGNISPGLNVGIGMAYVATEYATPGTLIDVFARNTTFPAEVVKMPFL